MGKDKKTRFYIGTSGWSYRHWINRFYPKNLSSSDYLPFYIRHFNTVEINASFYRMPAEPMIKRWQTIAPKGFLYAIKASRVITHLKKLKNVKEELNNFYQRAQLLGEALGIILFQLPPSLKVNKKLLEDFLSQLEPSISHAIEFRHPSWHTDKIFELLRKYRVSYCILSSPKMPTVFEITAPAAYVRFHGAKSYYNYDYPPEDIKHWAEELKKLRRKARQFFIFFNNDYNAYAVANALQLKEFMGLDSNRLA